MHALCNVYHITSIEISTVAHSLIKTWSKQWLHWLFGNFPKIYVERGDIPTMKLFLLAAIALEIYVHVGALTVMHATNAGALNNYVFTHYSIRQRTMISSNAHGGVIFFTHLY